MKIELFGEIFYLIIREDLWINSHRKLHIRVKSPIRDTFGEALFIFCYIARVLVRFFSYSTVRISMCNRVQILKMKYAWELQG
jgi:hypothetical protein